MYNFLINNIFPITIICLLSVIIDKLTKIEKYLKDKF